MWFCEYSRDYLENTDIVRRLVRMKSGIVLLQGPSGCGKSGIIRALRKTDSRSLHVFTVEEIREVYHFPKNRFDDSMLINADKTWQIICFEDVDLLKSNESDTNMMAYLINKLSGDALVIFTGIECEKRVPSLLFQIRLPILMFFHTSDHVANLHRESVQ